MGIITNKLYYSLKVFNFRPAVNIDSQWAVALNTDRKLRRCEAE